MEGEEIINPDSETQNETDCENETDREDASESDPESSSDSDWLSEEERRRKAKQPQKRKMKTQGNKNCSNSRQTSKHTVESKSQLPVTCGDKEGTLYLEKYVKVEKCILSEEQWFTPPSFEKFGGKERNKKWKISIFWAASFASIPLQDLIQDGYLSSPKFNRKRVQNEQHRRERLASSSPNVQSSGDSCDNIDMTMFQGCTLPVTCGSDCGILHKERFANGLRGKCIRTEAGWFTPEEFVMQEPTLEGSGLWKSDILCHGKALNVLLKRDILQIHPLLCHCKKCSNKDEDLIDQNNDDMCYACHTGGKLVCCDECPRAFHSDCHLPAIDGDSPGDWVCTFCVLKISQQWRYANYMTEQEALNAAVPQYRLYCHYLLLCVYGQDIQRVFVEEPRKTVARYSKCISRWLNRIKLKLENDEYQTVGEFVSDFQLIFSNCSTFRDNRFVRMGTKLKELFESDFRNVFTIQ